MNLIKKTKLRKLSLLVCFIFMFQLIILSPKAALAASIGKSTTSISYDIKGDPKIGNIIEIAVNVSNVNDLYGGSIDFVYDKNLLEIQSITKGNIFGSNTVLTPLGANGKIDNGQASFAISMKGNKPGVNGNGTLAIIKAKVLKEGTVNLNTTNSNTPSLSLVGNTIRVKLSNSNVDSINYTSTNKNINLSNTLTLSAGKYEETDPNIKYVGSWINDSNISHSGGSIKYSSTKDNYLEFSFEGTGFKIAQFANSFRGIANITIDNTSYTQDFHSFTSKYKDIVFSKLDLPYGKHTVKISVSGNKNASAAGTAIAIDYVEILNKSNPPEPSILSAGKYEETDPNIKYVGSWINDSNSSHSGGSIKYSSTKDNYLEFSFEGTGFKIAQFANNFRGIANITIDNTPYTQDFYSSTSKYKDIVFSKLDLPYGKHTVKISVSGNKNASAAGTAIAIDYIEILNTSNPPESSILSTGKYEETDPNIKYVGSWINDSNISHSGGSIKYSSIKDNYLEFTFEGTGFKIAQFANNYRGIANITIDNTPYTQDFYSSTSKYKDIVFSKLDLPYGKHTVKISVSGNKNASAAGTAIAIDYIEILNTSNPPESSILSAGKYEETNPNIKYVGSWINDSNSSYSGGSIKYSSTKDNYLEFTFEGTGFKIAQFANNYRGIANITIDNTSYTQDFYSSTSKYKDIAFSKLDLPYGKHTVKISVSGNKNASAAGTAIAIDYIEILK